MSTAFLPFHNLTPIIAESGEYTILRMCAYVAGSLLHSPLTNDIDSQYFSRGSDFRAPARFCWGRGRDSVTEYVRHSMRLLVPVLKFD